MNGSFTLPEIVVQTFSLQIYTTEKIKFTLYSFILVHTSPRHVYSWKLNKTYQEFQQLNRSLSRFPEFFSNSSSFPNSHNFYKASEEMQLELLHSYLASLLSLRSSSRTFSEFLEISPMSFTKQEKYKEGYVYKYGSALKSNQRRFCNCLSKLCGSKKRWLRILPDVVEMYLSSNATTPEDTILFSNKFKILVGKAGTGFKNRIIISTDRHNFMLWAENLQKRDEWVEALNTSFNKHESKLFTVIYDSSFMVREKNDVQFFVDGENYFNKVYLELSKATTSVCISDWWLSPDMYLKRPKSLYPDSQVVEMLGSLADRGVKVHVLLYKEVTFALTLNSLYTKKRLQERNRNIIVLRHPTVGIRGGEFFWSHHSKLICIDNTIAFLGGLDLCYGRWDTQEHPLVDLNAELFPGIDYSNVRVADFIKVHKYERDSIERKSVPRMPWHDVCVSLSGIVVKDLWIHFMEIWNHVIRDITGRKNRKDIISMLPETTTLQRIGNGLKNIITKEGGLGRARTIEFQGLITQIEPGLGEREEEIKEMKKIFYKNREVVNKNAMLPHEEDNNEETKENFAQDQGKNNEGKFNLLAVMQKIVEKNLLNPHPTALKHKLSSLEGDLEALNIEEEEDFRETRNSLKRSTEKVIIDYSKRSSVDFFQKVKGDFECQVLRSAGMWSMGKEIAENSIMNAYYGLILDAKNFIYIENQFFISNSAGKPVINTISQALIERIKIAIQFQEKFRVIVMIPLLPAFEGSVDDPSAAILRVQLHWEYQTICRGKSSIYSRLREFTDSPEDYISFYSLRTHSVILGTPVTEMIYIHSKLMIVDDVSVIIGSANINDRSMNGDRDAELCVLIRDKEIIESRLGDNTVEVAKFAYHFRMNLFKEHSGCDDEETLRDPLAKCFYKVWNRRARRNTRLYRKIFGCYPDDKITKMNMVKILSQDAKIELYEEESQKIIGNIVEFPLEFLSEENLKITVKNKEVLLPENTFV